MTRIPLLALALLSLLSASLYWSGADADRDQPADFVLINRGDITTLDPDQMSWLQDIRTSYGLWEGLYALSPGTLQPIPGTADRIDVSPDKLTWTFHIRDNARWSNNDDVIADDFLFAWQRMLQHDTDYVALYYYIHGAKDYNDAYTKYLDAAHVDDSNKLISPLTPPDFSTVGVSKLGPKTLQIKLDSPVTFLPALLSFPPFFPLNERSMRPFYRNSLEGYDPQFTLPPSLVGNGPYRLDKWDFKKRVRLVASNYYWDRQNVKSHTIDILSFDDNRVGFLAYETGGIDWLSEVSNDDAAELLKIGRKDVHKFPGFGTYFYSINCQKTLPDGSPNPMSDRRVRQALSMAIDKQPIIQNVARLDQPIATTFVPPGVFATYQSPHGLPYDVPAAKKLLADAGFPNGNNFPRLSILFNTEVNDHAQIAQIIAKQWADNLGIQIDLAGVEVKSFRTRLHSKNYQVARANWVGDYDDVSTFTDKYLSASANNDSAWNNPQYDDLCKQAAAETDPQKRLGLLSQAEQILCDDAPIIPLYHLVNVYVYHDNVRGLDQNPRDMVVLKSLQRITGESSP